MTYHRPCNKSNTKGVTVEQKLLTLLEHMGWPTVFSGVRFARPLVFCVVFRRSLFVLLFFFCVVYPYSIHRLWLPFGIFKLFNLFLRIVNIYLSGFQTPSDQIFACRIIHCITWYYIMTVTSRFTFTTLNCLTPGKRVVTHIYICYVSWREEVTFWEIFPRIWEISRFARTTKVMFPGIISWGKHYFSIWMYFI
jgi:hypothetical protein